MFYDLILETAPPVQILGTAPSTDEQGATLDVTIHGAGFRAGATVRVTFMSAAELRAGITIPCSGSGADRPVDVRVTNPEILFPNVARIFPITPSITDTDCDGAPNAQDCVPGDPTAFAVPAEVTGLAFESDKATLAFDSAAPGAGIGTVPVGSGPSETCVGSGVPGATVLDPSTPSPGRGLWYLVCGRNACGAGTYGTTSAGLPRATSACP